MLFDPSDAECKQKSAMYLAKLLQGDNPFEITEKVMRSLRQNAYLHLLLQYLAAETKNRTEYVKREWYKKMVNPDIFVYKFYDVVKQEVVEDLRSSSELTKDEMRLSIERLMIWSAEVAEVVLPEAEVKDDGRYEIKDKDFYKEVLKIINENKAHI